MIKTMRLFIVIFAIVLFCRCDNSNGVSLILIDTSRNYPESDLRLSDVAEVKYIPLQYGRDSIIFANPGPYAVTVYRDTICLLNWKPFSLSQIIQYDMSGNPLSKIDKIGRGPGEYTHLISYMLDTTRHVVYGWDDQSLKILTYDFQENCLKEKSLNANYTQMANLNNDYILGYNFLSLIESDAPGEIIDTGCKTITFLNKEDFTETVYDFDYEKPKSNRTPAIIYRNLTHTKEGIYITNDRSDTVYFLDKNLKLTPRIIDITPHSKDRMSAIIPTIETDRYLLLSNEYYLGNLPRSPDYYVYDKQEKQIFRLKKDKSLKNDYLLLANDYIAVNQFSLTQSHNYAASFGPPYHLREEYENLPPELKVIADTLDDPDNPVLMLIKFK